MTLQVTAVFVVFATVAVNCFCIPVFNVAVIGEMLIETGKATVTTADPDFDGSAIDVAVTVTCAGVGSVAGAVYTPPEVIVPHPDPPQDAPERLHVTPVIVVPLTKATNCSC